MAVGVAYLAKIQRAVRLVNPPAAITQELTDTIEEARADLERLGLASTMTNDETDYHILDAVKRYARWRFAMEPGEAARCAEEYKEKADELRRMRDYAYLSVAFLIETAAHIPIADAEVTFNGETVETGATGYATFYYVRAGTNQEYTVNADGYVSQTVDLDVTASAQVTVTMVAA